jgi:hypothetical protein
MIEGVLNALKRDIELMKTAKPHKNLFLTSDVYDGLTSLGHNLNGIERIEIPKVFNMSIDKKGRWKVNK